MSARNSTDIVSQTMNTVINERTTVIVGDSITKNVQGIKLAKTVGHRVVVKIKPSLEPQFATCQGHPTSIFGKYLFRRRFERQNFRNISCKIPCFPASPWVFEHLKNGIIAHF